MVKYRLCYFNGRGLAEVPRWIFAYAEHDYEDFRWANEDWVPKYKQSSPTGQGPYLEVEGVKIAQSSAISRYLAKQFGIAGKDDLEQALVDMVAGCVDDFRAVFRPIIYEQDADKKEELRVQIAAEKAPAAFERMENLLKSNLGGDGYFVGESLTWADLQAAYGMHTLVMVKLDEELDKYPKLKSHRDRILQIPQIATWIAKRPDTPF